MSSTESMNPKSCISTRVENILKPRFLYFVLIVSLLLVSGVGYAQNKIEHLTTMLDGALGQLKQDSIRIVEDTSFSSCNAGSTLSAAA